MATLGSNQVTDISSVVNSTDGASKQYVDLNTPIPITGNENNFLYTNGTNVSWQPIAAFQEYTTAGTYTYTIPPQAKELFIEATGAGGGGASGITTGSSYVSGSVWTLRTTLGGTYAITYASDQTNKYLIVYGSSGLATSPDGATWSSRTSGLGAFPISLTYGNGLYIAVGTPPSASNGSVITSTDAISWTLRTAGTSTGWVLGTTFASDKTEKYVIGCESGRLNSSTDGINWTLRTSGTASSIYNLTYGNGVYLYYARNFVLASSTDAINWTLRTAAYNGQLIYEMCYAGDKTEKYLAVGSGAYVASSTDAIIWTFRTSSISGSLRLFGAAYGNGTYVISGDSGVLATSTDAVTWSQRTSQTNQLLGNNAYGGPGIVYGNNLYLVSGNALTVSPSTVTGMSGGGGGSGANVFWSISKDQIISSTININVGAGGTANTAGAATTISWTGPNSITYSMTVNGGSAGSNTGFVLGGAGGAAPVNSSNFIRANPGLSGANGRVVEVFGLAASNSTTSFQSTGGGGGAISAGSSTAGGLSGLINYYNNTQSSSANTGINGLNSTAISGLSYGIGGNGGSASSTASGNGGSGSRGSGGGGGAYSSVTNTAETGGTGGDGYVRISWS